MTPVRCGCFFSAPAFYSGSFVGALKGESVRRIKFQSPPLRSPTSFIVPYAIGSFRKTNGRINQWRFLLRCGPLMKFAAKNFLPLQQIYSRLGTTESISEG